jgi:hypothetical protein
MGGLGNSTSIGNMLQGLSRDQLNQFARERGVSSASISNILERKTSFDALMSLDFQSLQSIDNLANLVQSNSANNKNVPSSGMQNWSLRSSGTDGSASNASTASLSTAARRLAAVGNMESLLRSLSNNNVNKNNTNANSSNGGASHANLQSLLQNMHNGSSMSSLLAGNNGMGNAQSVASLANLLRDNSSTGLSALRMQEGLNQRNSSVEDFLNLVADGYIPHQDPSLLSVPLMQHQQQQQGGQNVNDPATLLAQQQLLAQATGNSQLANALASRSFGNIAGSESATAALFAQAAASADSSSQSLLKRRFMEMGGDFSEQGSNKR